MLSFVLGTTAGRTDGRTGCVVSSVALYVVVDRSGAQRSSSFGIRFSIRRVMASRLALSHAVHVWLGIPYKVKP